MSTYSMDISPVMKQYTKMPQHTVRAAAVRIEATQPPHDAVEAAPCLPILRRI